MNGFKAGSGRILRFGSHAGGMTENTPPHDESAPQPQQPQQGAAWWQQQSAAGQPGGNDPYGGGTPGTTQQQSSLHYTMPIGTAPAREGKKHRFSRPIMVTGVVAALVGGGIGIGGSALLSDNSSGSSVLTTATPSANNASTKPGSVAHAAKVTTQSTVDIKVASGQGGSEGTGIVLSKDGYVLTNNHVVSGAEHGGRIQVTNSDGKKYSAKVQGTAPSYDLAVIKLDGADSLHPATMGSSEDLQVGQSVAAVGSPFGLTESVTSGIVSALNRTVTTKGENGDVVVYNGLQTDASINQGNSGGPLVNMAGQVIGVNSAINTGSGGSGGGGGQGSGSVGIGYSIPVDTAKRVAQELIKDGKATKPMLGVTGTVTSSGSGGAQVSDVQSDGPADKAGIKKGDVVTKLDKRPLRSYADLMAQVLKHHPGEKIPVTVKHRGGSSETVKVQLEGTQDTQQTTVSPKQQGPFGNFGDPDGPGGGPGGGSGGPGGGSGGGGSGGGFGFGGH